MKVKNIKTGEEFDVLCKSKGGLFLKNAQGLCKWYTFGALMVSFIKL